MDYSEIEKEIIDLTNSSKYQTMPAFRNLCLRRITMLMELEKIKELKGIRRSLASIESNFRNMR